MKLVSLFESLNIDDVITDFIIDERVDMERLELYIRHSIMPHNGMLMHYLREKCGYNLVESMEACQNYFKLHYPDLYDKVVDEYDLSPLLVGTTDFQEYKEKYLERLHRQALLDRFSKGDDSAWDELFGSSDDD
jgi:hypothetical protein